MTEKARLEAAFETNDDLVLSRHQHRFHALLDAMNHLQSQLYCSKDPISSSGPFASLDKSAAKVKLHCPEVLVFLRPLSSFGAGTAHFEASGPWPVFRGVLELDLPKMKRIEDIRVQCAYFLTHQILVHVQSYTGFFFTFQ